MSDAHDYSNLDLDTAENLLIAAGKPELAEALRFQAQGVRNLVQGEWGQSFVNALDGVLARRLNAYDENNTAILAGVNNSLQLLNLSVEQVLNTAKKALTVAKAGAARLGKLEKDSKTLKDGQARISREVTDLDTRHKEQWNSVIERLDADEERLDRKRQELDDHQRRLARIEARLGLDDDGE